MAPIRKPLGLAAAAFCAVSFVFACTAPLNSIEGSDGPGGSRGSSGAAGTEDGDGGVRKGDGVKTKTGLPCDVSKVLSESCQTCHGAEPKSGASTSLVSWNDLQQDYGGKKLYEVVKTKIHAEAGRMPPAARLTDAQIKAVDDWIANGAPQAADTCDVGEGPPPPTRPFTCNGPNTKTTVLKASKPFTWTDNSKSDQYMCFGVDEVIGSKRHVIAMGPKVENLNIVHHILLFQAQEAMSSDPQPCGATVSGSWKMVTGWAPGGGNMELPPEAGYPTEGTTHWVMQVHYNNASGKFNGQTDNSGYQLCSTDQLRPNDAGTLAFGSKDFTIPPRVAKWTLRCDYKLGDKYKGVHFFGATPHMHTRGIAISTERIPGGNGAPDLVFGQEPFNFENQEGFKISKDVSPGDIMRTRCTWKNPGDTPITWGENTTDEMCFNFLTYYPAIPDQTIGPLPVQTWISPSLGLPVVGVKCEQEP